jgi:predicted nucleotidyltransferase
MTTPRRRPSEILADHRDDVRRIVHANRGREVRVFGSVARGEDTLDSDLDLLVDFEKDADLLDQISIGQVLRDLLGIDVDVVSSRGLRGDRGAAVADGAVPV